MLLFLYFVKLLFFISSTVVPDDIGVFQMRSNESSVYNLKRFPVKFEFKSSHYMLCLLCILCVYAMYSKLIR